MSNGQDVFISKKLFGPFNGLNDSQSPFLRELPPAPNAKPREFATEFQNLEIDQKTQELVSRLGIEYVQKGSTDVANRTILATSGIFKWIDYDTVTGTGRARGIQLVIDNSGFVYTYVYRRIKTEVRITDAALDGKKFAIIEDPDASSAKRFIIYNVDGTIYSSATTLAGLANTTASYLDWDTNVDGAIVTSAVDLVQPTTMTYSAANGNPTSVAAFWSLAYKRTLSTQTIQLSSWVTTLNTSTAAFFTATQVQNCIYFSGAGVGAILKFDGVSLYKAGMPHAAIGKGMTLTSMSVATFSANYSENINALREGLMNPQAAANVNYLGNFVYAYAYERGDAKNNYIEGQAYLKGTYSPEDPTGSPVVGVTISPQYKALTELTLTAGVVSGNVMRYAAPCQGGFATGAVESGFEPRSATIASNQIFTADPAANFTILCTSDTSMKQGDICCFRATLHTANTLPTSDYNRFPVLITGKVATVVVTGMTTTSITIDYTYPITIEIVPGGDIRANNLSGLLSNMTDDSTQALLSSLTAITTWKNLFAWTWLGLATTTKFTITTEFCMSNNFRINIYRNKANINEGNSYDPTANNGTYIPDMYLVNILPNDYFHNTAAMGNHYDNCKDSCLGAQYIAKVPLQVEDNGGADLTALDYSPLPKGRALNAFKGRLYITDDPLNTNIIWRSDLVYGAEWFSVDDTLSVESPVGDAVVQTIGNNNVIYVLKSQGVKTIIFDLDNTKTRVDDYIVGDFGCVSARSAVTNDKSVIYLSQLGPAIIQIEEEPKYLGANHNGVSRIRQHLNDSTLDLSRSVGFMDNAKNQYILYVPAVSKASVGLYNPADIRSANNPYYNDQGVTFVYDFSNDTWSKWTGINAKGGIVELDGRNFFVTAYAKNTSESASGLDWVLYKTRDYSNLWSYTDRLERSGVEELRAISKIYTTDWLALDDAGLLKKFLRCRVYQLNTFTDLSVKGTSGTSLAATGAVSVTVNAYRDWRSTLHSSASLDLTGTNFYDFMKIRTNRCGVMQFSVTHNVINASPRIQAIEIEAAAPFKPHMKPWNVS